MKKILLLLNPASRQGAQKFLETQKLIHKRGWSLLNSEQDLKNHSFTDLILRYQKQADLVLVGGGDGSINAALSALVQTQIPLGILPMGTANNMARTLKIPGDLEKALDIVGKGHLLKIDLGSVNGIYFVNVAGMGLSTHVNRKVSPYLKKWLGAFAFVITAFRVARYIQPLHTTIFCEDRKYVGRAWQITVCNGRNYGSGLTVAEDATLVDETLHCLSTEVEKWWQGFFLIPAMLIGKYKSTHEVNLLQGQKFRIETTKPYKIDVDGDIKTETPAQFEIHPKAIAVFITPELLQINA